MSRFANGNPVSITDPSGNPTTHAFDALNRRIETTDASNGVTAYTYDAAGNRTSRTDARGVQLHRHPDKKLVRK